MTRPRGFRSHSSDRRPAARRAPIALAALLLSGLAAARATAQSEDHSHLGARAATNPSEAHAVAVPGTPGQVGRWETPIRWPVTAIHAATLPTGKVLTLSYGDPGAGSNAVVWTPSSGKFKAVPYTEEIFCAGHSFLPDGRLYLTGGWKPTNCPTGGLDQTTLFDPATETWTGDATMQVPRYYPSNLTLGDGRILIFGGYNELCRDAPKIETYSPETGLRTLGTRAMALYPEVQLLTNGSVAHIGPEGKTEVFNPASKQWRSIGFTLLGEPRLHGTAFQLPGRTDSFMICGGYATNKATPTATCETIDFSRAAPKWTQAPPMNAAKAHMNHVLLPDGTVLIVGGGQTSDYEDPVLNPELYDPRTNSWKLLPPQQLGRMYHSTALLLPDGRVLSAGQDAVDPSGKFSGDYAEIYRPAYLFRTARPVIEEAPESFHLGDPVQVKLTQQAKVNTTAVLIGLSAVTHSVNMGQRFVPLEVTAMKGKKLSLAAPSNPSVAPPGYYMLFVLSPARIPSIARIVQVLPKATAAAGEPAG